MTKKGDFYYFTHMAVLVVCAICAALCLSGCGSDKDGAEILLSDTDGYAEGTSDADGSGASDENLSDGGAQEKSGDIYVYVCGEVNDPGVYIVADGARLYEVIELAGGMTDEAAEGYLNLAAEVYDGEQVNVISKEEYDAMSETGEVSQSNDNAAADDGLININTASADELTALPGIGEVKAQAIVDYRESNGDFKSADDIMNVSGIGESTYAKISGLIKVK